jgi:hypothetical protein
MPRPTGAQLDAQSKIVLRGCVLGNNQSLLNRIRTIFGNNVFLYAPKYLQYYEFRGATSREGFWEQLLTYVRMRRLPNARRAEELLAQAHPTVDRAELRQLLRGRRTRHHRVQRMGPFTFNWRSMPNRPSQADAERQIETMFDGLARERRFGTDFDDWVWQIRIRRRGRGAYQATGNGYRSRLEVRRPLLDAEGNPVVPDLTNSAHYGRSPSW